MRSWFTPEDWCLGSDDSRVFTAVGRFTSGEYSDYEEEPETQTVVIPEGEESATVLEVVEGEWRNPYLMVGSGFLSGALLYEIQEPADSAWSVQRHAFKRTVILFGDRDACHE